MIVRRRQRFCAQPRADPVRKLPQRRPENLLLCRLPPERRLRSRRLGAVMRPDFPGIAIPRQRTKLVAQGAPEQPLQSPSRDLRQLPDLEHAHLRKSGLGDRAHAPHQFDRQVVQEFELFFRGDHDEPVRFGDLRSDLGEVFRACDADRDR